MKKIRLILYYFLWALPIILLLNAALLLTGQIDFVIFTFTSFSWFEPQEHEWVAILILEICILSPAVAILITLDEKDPVPD